MKTKNNSVDICRQIAKDIDSSIVILDEVRKRIIIPHVEEAYNVLVSTREKLNIFFKKKEENRNGKQRKP